MILTNLIKQWWRTIDQQAVIAYGILIAFSFMLVTTTSSAVAGKIGLVDNYFSSRQILHLFVGAIFMVAFSSLDKKWIKRIRSLRRLSTSLKWAPKSTLYSKSRRLTNWPLLLKNLKPSWALRQIARISIVKKQTSSVSSYMS